MKKILCISLFLLISLFGFSQNENKTPWHGKMKAGASFYKGNVNKFNLKGAFLLSNKDSINEFSLFSTANYSKVDNEVKKEEYSGGIKYDFIPFSVVSPFMLAQVYTNRQKKIRIRYSGLLGGKYTFLNTNKLDFSISIAGQYDHENYYLPEEPDDDFIDTKDILRISVRPKFNIKITDDITFTHYTFYQPSPFDFNDYRVYSKTSLNTKFYKKISINLEYIYEFDNITVDEDVLKDDSSFFVTFAFKF